jgi:K+-transporting ATPase ATPase B chain
LTVIFANFAEAMAEGRGKAQADTLRKMRSETEARRLNADGTETLVPAAESWPRGPGGLRGQRPDPLRR